MVSDAWVDIVMMRRGPVFVFVPRILSRGLSQVESVDDRKCVWNTLNRGTRGPQMYKSFEERAFCPAKCFFWKN